MTYPQSADPCGPHNPQPHPGTIPTPYRKASEEDLPDDERRGRYPSVPFGSAAPPIPATPISEATRLALLSGPLHPARLDAVVLACRRHGEHILDHLTDVERQHLERILATLPSGATWESALRLVAGL